MTLQQLGEIRKQFRGIALCKSRSTMWRDGDWYAVFKIKVVWGGQMLRLLEYALEKTIVVTFEGDEVKMY